jgi:hypothetical protein
VLAACLSRVFRGWHPGLRTSDWAGDGGAARQRDLDVAVGLGMTSIDLIEGVDSTRGIGDLHDLYRHLKPHAKVPAVRDFLEQARGLVTV